MKTNLKPGGWAALWLLGLLCFAPRMLPAQGLVVDQPIINFGGGTITSGSHEISGTLGQSIVGTASSTDKEFYSGLWEILRAYAFTDIALSSSSVSENEPTGKIVGALSAPDPEDASAATFTLVAGLGDTDNASFTISGANLVTAAVFNYESKSSYSIRVRATDSLGEYYEKALTITVNNVNETPSNISLSGSSVNENIAVGSTVGTLSATDQDAGDTAAFTLVTGTGDTDNGYFDISGTALKTKQSIDYEAKSSLSLRVRVTDGGGLTFEKVFTIAVNNVNEAPTDISLSATSVLENQPSGTTVGTLSATDPDAGTTITFSLVSGYGDNASFTIVGNTTLNGTAVFNYESKSSYSIKVRATDNTSLTFDKTFTITVVNVNEAPTLNALTSVTLLEDAAAQTVSLGGISTGGDSGQTLTITASSSNTALIPNPAVTYSSGNTTGTLAYTPVANLQGTATITVIATDNGGTANGGVNTVAQSFTVTVIQVNDAPTLDALTSVTVDESAGAQTVSLSGIGTGAPNETQTLTFTATSSNTGLIPNPTITYAPPSATGTLTYTPAVLGANGIALITVTLTDNGSTANGGVTTTTRSFMVIVTGVNDAPTLATISDPAAILEDAGLQTISLSDITAGGGESQTLTVVASSSNTGLIPNPTVTYTSPNPTGTLTYTPVANANGVASIAVTVTDSGNTLNGGIKTVTKTFKVNITAVNDVPTLDALTSVTINEDAVVQTVNLTGIGIGAANEGQTLTVTVGASLSSPGLLSTLSVLYTSPQSSGTLNFTPAANASGTATISVTVRDNGGTASGGVNTFTRTFTVSITPVADAPTDIFLSAASLNENLASGSTVGTLTTADADAGDTATFALVSGGGSTDNTSFTIDGTSLKTAAVFNYEAKSSYAIRLRMTDSTSLTFEKEFTISVNDVNEAPTDIAVAVAGVNENAAVGALAGTFGATDVDADDTATFTLVAGTGDTGNANFEISGTNLLTKVVLNYETATSHSVRVRVTDAGGLTFEKAFTIAVTNVNEAPTDISLSASTIYENLASGSTIGTLTASDVDASDTATFTLVSGALNNNKFSLTGGALKNGEAFNYEVKSSYDIRVRVTDGGNNTFDKDFTITVLDTNEPPTNLALSAATVAENQPANTFVGSFSANEPDTGDTKTFALVSGTGDTDNGSFTIATRHLKTAASFDYETKSSYSIRVAVFDSAGLGMTNIYTITVVNVNEAPATPALSASSVAENAASGTTVGTLTAPDPDAGDTVAFSLVSGTGDANNGAFAIVGSALKTAAVFDRETQPTQSVRVRATDSVGLTSENTFTITVNNLNEAPADILLSATSIAENSASGSTVGTLTASDVDASDTATFTLVSGTGSTDNGSFTIVTGALKTAAVFNYETKSSYSIRLRVTDGGSLTFEKAFTITVNNVNETPTDIALSSAIVIENVEIGATVGSFSATDPDIGDTATFTLVSGTGDTDNAAFAMDGSALTTAAAVDYETKSSYSLRVRVTDGGANTFEEVFAITVVNVTEGHVVAGTPLWTNLFNGAANTNDQAAAVAADTNGNVFVTGFSQTGATSTKDYLTVAYSSLGVPLWTNSYGGPGNNADEAAAVAVNTNGDVLVTGFSRSGGANTEDYATVAYSSAGVPLWTNRYNGPGSTIDQALALAVDGSGNVFVTGYSFNGTDNDFATVAYSSAGVPLWTNRYNGPGSGDDQAKKVAVDASGNVFVTGYSFNGTDTDFATVAYSSAGVALWTNRYNGTGSAADAATAVGVDGSGNVYVTGNSSNGSNNDYATVAYSSAGTPLWTNRCNPNNSTDNAYALAVDGSGNVYVTGESAGGGNGSDYLTVAYSSAGTALWTNRYNAPGNNNDTARAVTVHNNGSVYVTGIARTGGTSATEDFATVAYSTSGTALWTNRYNGLGSVSDQALAVAVDGSGNVLVAGYANNGTNNDFATVKYAGNFAPTNLTLSASSVNENAASGTTVGTFSAADPDTGDTATYSLVSGTGSTDNGSFSVVSGALKTAAVFNYEVKSSYSIRVRATDSGKLTFDKVFAITVNNVNDSPTDISLTASSVVEHAASGTSVGVLSTTDADAGDTATFTFATGTGSTDNASFNISNGTNLVTAAVFDYEVKTSYAIRVRGTDSGGLTFEKAFTITVNNVNEAPTDISLSAATVAENAASGTTIGTLTATDVDAGDTKTFSFATGAGDTDNGSFSIVGSALKSAAVFNYEAKSSYSIRVRVTDAGGLTYDEVFVVDVTNVNEAPTDISVSSASVGEDAVSGSTVGTLSAADQDAGDSATFTLVSGTGSTDNGSFTLDGTSLITATALDYETKNSYSLRVRVTDSTSLTFEKVLTISITDVNEAPTAISLSASSVAENAASGTGVGSFTTTDVDAGDTASFTFVAGSGDTDNASFSVSNGTNLLTAAVFNYETKSSYSLRVRVTDGGGLTFENTFTLTVTNVNEGPTDILPTGFVADWVSMGASVPGVVGPSSSQVRAIVTNGGNIYVGGTFSVAGTVVASNVAKWNGTTWSALGAGLGGTVNALVLDASGNLYAGGSFTNVGGSGANYIAKWNGFSWTSPGTGLGGAVNALAFDASGNLYAGGSFTNAGGVSASRIAKWNGSSWASLGSGVNSTVNALAVDASGNLYAAGNFITAGGATVNRIAKWDGTAWSALGTGMSGGTPTTVINALAVDGSGNLYAGGVFTSAGGTSASRMAKWNGSAWSALGTGIPNTVNALALDGSGNLYAGGGFSTAGGNSAANIAKWDGGAWSALGTGLGSTAFALALDGSGNLYAGGGFTTAGGTSASAFAKWNGSAWSAAGTWTGLDGLVRATAVMGANLYVAGDFVTAGGITVNRIAKWDGAAWSALGSGISGGNNQVQALAVIGTNLYAGGHFTLAGGVTVAHIAKWNGTSWSSLNSQMGNTVAALAVIGTDLYAGGAFLNAGGLASADRVAKYDTVGGTWSALGTGCDNTVRALAVSGTDLYVGGSIDFAGGISAKFVAKWSTTGSTWSALGTGLNSAVRALAIDASGNLCVGGDFTTAGGLSANRIAKWNGSAWSTIGSSGMNNPVYALVVDGGGNLYAGGGISTADGSTANRVAKWNGSAWSAVGSGMDGSANQSVMAMTFLGSDLYAGGGFSTASGKASPYLAKAQIGVAENAANGTTVATLTTVDVDSGDPHTFTLVSGAGDTDNGTFTITGSALQSAAAFDYETKASYSVRVRSTDGGGLTVEKVFGVSVTNVNDTPTDITLTGASVAENQPSGSTVGTLAAADQDTGDTATFSLVSGAGSADNASFTISGSTLQTSASFDYETKNSYSIRVRATDSGGLTYEEAFTITVNNVNDGPTDINLSAASVAENAASGATVGSFTATDADAGDTATFTFAGGVGSEDNASFTISGGTLQTAETFDFEIKNSYSVRVQVTDAGGLMFEKAFTIAINDANDTPVDIALSAASVAENAASGTSVGSFTATDVDAGDTHTFTLVSGAGSADNANFTIAGGTLQTAAAFDYETKASHSLRVRGTDAGGLFFEKQFTVTVSDVNDAPSNVSLSASSVAENAASGTTVGVLAAADQDAGDTAAFTLVSGAGDTDNASFTLAGNTLQTVASFDYETKRSLSLRVRATDGGGLPFEQQLTVSVTEVYEYTAGWTNRYDGPASGNDQASAVAVDAAGNVFVAGYAHNGANNDYTTIKYLADGTAAWTNRYDGPGGSDDVANALVVDGSGNVLVTGFSPGSGTSRDYATIKYLSDGTPAWTNRYDGPGGTSDEAAALAVDTAGNVFVTGFSGSDYATVAYSSAGAPVWTNRYNGPANSTDEARAVAVDGAGNVFVTGFSVGSGSSQDYATIKYSAAGTPLWTNRYNGPGNNSDLANALAVDGAGNVFVTGYSRSGGSSTAEDYATVAYSNAGVPLWTNRYNGTGSGSDHATAVAADVAGDVFVTGFSPNGGGNNDFATVKYSGAGVPLWTNRYNAGGADDRATALALDSSGQVFVAGYSGGAVQFTTIKYSNAGAPLRTNFYNGPGNSTDQAQALAVDHAGNAFVAGNSVGSGTSADFAVVKYAAYTAPASIALSAASVAENSDAGTTVGTLTAQDFDAGDTAVFTLVSGAGDTDNASFAIEGVELQTAASFDYETKSSYSLRVRATDGLGLTYEQVFTVNVQNVNEAPTGIDLDNIFIAENQPSGTVVGALTSSDADAGDTVAYTLVSGEGDVDNAAFTIVNGTNLATTAAFDYETQDVFTLRVRATDAGGLFSEEQFYIVVDDLIEAPTNILLSNASVAENQAASVQVGILSAVDQDIGDTATFALVSGAGGDDNGSFSIVNGTNLVTAATFDFETKNSYSVRVRVTDSGDLAFEKIFTVTINDVNDAPTDISLSAGSVAENAAIGTPVGTLAAADVDAGDTATFTLVSGGGGDDNGSFSLVGAALQTAAVFNYEVKNSYSVRVRVTDGGGLGFEKQFIVTVTDVNEVPVNISLNSATVAENEPVGTLVGALSATDPDAGDAAAFTLVAGPGSQDNGAFSLVNGTNLVTTEMFDFEFRDSYSVRVRATDGGGLHFEKVLTLGVTDVNETPADIELSPASVAENAAPGTVVGVLASLEYDFVDTAVFALVSGDGDADNALFSISDGTNLVTAAVFDYEATNSYSLRVRVTDSATNVFERQFTIAVTDVNEFTITNQTVALTEDTGAQQIILGSSVASGATYLVLGGPAHGTVSVFGNIATYTAFNNFQGLDIFTYILSNALGTSTVATVTVNVANVLDILPYAFSNAVNYAVGLNPAAIVAGKFGKTLGLAVANYSNNTVSLLFNSGKGYFTNAVPPTVAVGNGPVALATANFNSHTNKDTKPDLVVAHQLDETLQVLLGDGLGGFTNLTPMALDKSPSALAVGDLNKDTRADVVLANGNDETITVLLGLGDGTFVDDTNFFVGTNPVAVAVADFNKDLKADVATANYGGNSVSILWGVGTGALSNAVHYAVGANPTALAAGDFNKDGRVDLVVANYGDDTISVLLSVRQTNSGVRTNTFIRTDYPVGIQPSAVVVTNLNKDAWQDIIVAGYYENTVQVLLGRTNGAFEPYYNDPSATEPVGTNPIALAVGNFNADTDLDVAVANWGSGNVSILLNNYTPVAYAQKINVVEDTATPITLTATFGPLNYLILSGPTNGSFLLTNGAMSNATASPVLTYLPGTNANGKDLITFKVQDDGGKTSKVVKVEITILPVNDAPSFNLASNAIELAEDSPKRSITNFATDLNRGADGHATEAKQMHYFVVTNSASNLFKVQPALTLAGTNTLLTFEPAKNAHGEATVGVFLKDKSGTANGGVDTSAQAFFTLTITNVNDVPALFNWPAAFPTVKTNSSTNITFAVWDADTGTNGLSYSVNWTNTALFADAANKGSLTAFASTNFAFGTVGTNRTLTVYPAFGQKGTDKLIVTLYDGTNSISKTNSVTVK